MKKRISFMCMAVGALVALLPTFTACQLKDNRQTEALQQTAGSSQVPATKPVVHAHRGGAAEYPENTIEAMLHAVSIGIPVLEMDLHVTHDHRVVVSHDPYLNAAKILTPEGGKISSDREHLYAIYTMAYDSLKQYDAGSLFNPRYPQRKQLSCSIPLVGDLIDSVETYTTRHQISPVSYNIEIKSWPDKDGIYTPDYRTFADLCLKELLGKNLGHRLIVQCFDARTLNYLHEQYPQVTLSYLIEPEEGVDFDLQMKRLTFTPPIISPHHQLVDDKFMEQAQSYGMQVIPWTVDDRAEVLRLTELGVDAIITNQPSNVVQWLQ